VQYYISDNLYSDLEELLFDVKTVNPVKKIKQNLKNSSDNIAHVASDKYINDYAKKFKKLNYNLHSDLDDDNYNETEENNVK